MDSLAWRIGDGLIPDPYRQKLYTTWYGKEFKAGDELVKIDLNYWSWIHVLSGFLFALAFPQATFLIWFIIHIIWEFYQIHIGMTDIWNEPIGESIDITFDTLFSMFGFYLGRLLIR